MRRDFLPRGEGCVTRCPLVLTLRHDPDAGDREVVTFIDGRNGMSGNENNKMVNPDWGDVRREIEERTRNKAGREAKYVIGKSCEEINKFTIISIMVEL